mmetsp:Transcript_103561/g.221487  ORF Transcript_103561/g.221487 Transcript_103561/m.221487 type:complete len:388 (-) Transcript_103561:117-1280(-)
MTDEASLPKVERYPDVPDSKDDCAPCRGVCASESSQRNSALVSYVGDNRGAYSECRTYTYVGKGAGAFELMPAETSSASSLGWCLALTSIAVALLIVLGFWGVQGGLLSRHLSDEVRFDCEAGYSNWKLGWSIDKKAWCCDHFALACPPKTTSEPFDCTAGYSKWRHGWSVEKKAWCCDNARRGCPEDQTTVRYDCDADFRVWASRWSVDKKAWCCQYARRGCPTTPAPMNCMVGNPHVDWDLEKKTYCCATQRRGCPPTPRPTSSMPYDCNAGYVNWRAGWSSAKKAWCCSHSARGCASAKPPTPPPAPTAKPEYDCNASFGNCYECMVRQWSSAKLEFCCRTTGRGCPTTPAPEHFNCMTGVNNWRAAWSNKKKAWCCVRSKVGC